MNVLVCGLPGTGKTFFGRLLAQKIKALHLSSDSIRNDLMPIHLYDDLSKMEVYQTMLVRMEEAIKVKTNTVLDATFYKADIRHLFKEKAAAMHSKLCFIEIRASDAVIKERINRKRQDSDADFKVYLQIKEAFEPLQEAHLTLYSDQQELNHMLNEALIYIGYPHETSGN
jgi:predicted kinase